jgi:phospholipid/cholesterol/gamma-HCH transport system ATP-binding protein
MIVFDRVSLSFGSHRVFQDLNLSIGKAERVAVLGGSGEGKSTILKLILGLVRPDSGRIIIDGEEITNKKEAEMRSVRRKFSIVFQEGALFDSLSVKENVAFCMREYSDLSEEEIDRRVTELLGVVGVAHAKELMPEELSGGMHRRVSIARSLAACNPQMFLYDEPTSGLDPVNAENICKLILDLSGNEQGFIIVTHKVYDAIAVAERFIFLYSGKILFDGTRKQLLDTDIPEIRHFIKELHFTNI